MSCCSIRWHRQVRAQGEGTMTSPEPRQPHVHESVGVFSRGPCEAPRVTICACGATKREGFNWTQPPGPHSFDTLPAEQRAELQLFAVWLGLPRPKVPFETYRAEHLPKPNADLSVPPLPGEWARDPAAEEPPPPELREAALRWLRIIASPVPGASYTSPAVSQADNAKTILAHVASLSSQLEKIRSTRDGPRTVNDKHHKPASGPLPRASELLAEIESRLGALRSLNVGESTIASFRSSIEKYADAVACDAADQVWEQVEALGGTKQ